MFESNRLEKTLRWEKETQVTMNEGSEKKRKKKKKERVPYWDPTDSSGTRPEPLTQRRTYNVRRRSQL